jgi:hypothetical protein
MANMNSYAPGSKCSVTKRRHAETISQNSRFCGSCGMSNPLHRANPAYEGLPPAYTSHEGYPTLSNTPQGRPYIDLTSPEIFQDTVESPAQSTENGEANSNTTRATSVRNPSVLPIPFNLKAASAQVVGHPPGLYRSTAPPVSAGKVPIGIGELSRLKDREVKQQTGFDVYESIIIDFQLWLRLPKTMGGVVSTQWKKPDQRKRISESHLRTAH